MSDTVFWIEFFLAAVMSVLSFLWVMALTIRVPENFCESAKAIYRLRIPVPPMYGLLIFLFLSMIGTVLITSSMMQVLRDFQQFYDGFVLVPATVTKKYIEHIGKHTDYIVAYTFCDLSDDGKEWSGSDSVPRKFYKSIKLEDQVEVLYLPRPPYRFFLKEGESPFADSLATCVTFLLIYLFMLILSGVYMWQGTFLKNEGKLVVTSVLSMYHNPQTVGYFVLFGRLESTSAPFCLLVSRSIYVRMRAGDDVVFRYVPGAPQIFRPMWRTPARSVTKV